MIQTVKEQRDIKTNQLDGYIINGNIFVPIDPNNTYYQQVQEWIKQGNIPEPAFTKQQRVEYLQNLRISELKNLRQQKVNNIIATITLTDTTKVNLNGDELSQTRMTRALLGMSDTDKIDWITADNTLVQLTKADLQNALLETGKQQTQIFVIYQTIRQKIWQETNPDKLLNGIIDWDNEDFKQPVEDVNA